MIREAISKLVKKEDLTSEEASQSLLEVMEGNATSAQIAAFLMGMRMKGETAGEIAACAKIMREQAHSIHPKAKFLVDTCGTGGDSSNTFNISTAAAFIACGAGAAVAKHGNRSVSSKCGSADVLAELGVFIELPPEKVKQCINEVGMGFLFAPLFHPAMKHAAPVRKEIGVRTLFNLLGPLANPAHARFQLLGVFAPEFAPLMAEALKNLGAEAAMVVHGNGLDEITLCGKTTVCELRNGTIREYTLNPEDFGFCMTNIGEIRGGTAAENAAIIRDILKGGKGPKRDIAVLNAAAALVVAGIAKDMKEGVQKASESIDSGKAMKILEDLIAFTNEYAPKNNQQ